MTIIPAVVVSLASALGIGLLVGLERERRSQCKNGPAGLRTFALAALLGWVGLSVGGPLLLSVFAGGLTVLLAAVRWRRSPDDEPGLTTEVALLLVLVLGAQSVNAPALAVGIAVVLTLLLAYRENLHHFVRAQLSETEVRDGLIMACAALVILPLLPDTFIGPYDAINLRTVWMLCVLMMGISAIGHLAVRLTGSRYGLPLAGFIAGFASSTATIASMGDRSRRDPALRGPAAAAAVMSSVATMMLMAMVLAAIDTTILSRLLLPLLLGAICTFAYAAYGFFSVRSGVVPDNIPAGHVFDWRLTLGVAVAIMLTQLLSALLFRWLGSDGLLMVTTISGFADTHASAAAAAVLVPAGKITADAVALPILAAMSSNVFSKCVMAWVSGGNAFALRVVPGLLLPLLAMWLCWWFA